VDRSREPRYRNPMATPSRAYPVRLSDLAIDPYPVFARLREHEPVAWIEDAGMWFVTRYNDIVQVLRDPETFRTDAARSTIRDTFGESMLSVEGEQHRRYKSQCSGPFNTRAVRDHAIPLIEVRVRALLDGFAGRAVDLRPSLASPLAVYTVGSVLGIPVEFHATIRRWYEDFAAALANFGWDDAIRARGHASVVEFREAMRPVLRGAERTADPSLLGVLARHRPDRLADDEIVANALIVLFGGIETTESTLLDVIWTLLSHVDALAAVRRDPVMLSAAIEEAMRWEPAVQSCTRHVGTPTELAGVRLEPGAIVQCMLGAANRDPAHFPDPDRYDIRRANAGDHLSFGSGRHFCLGAALARAEVRLAVELLLSRYPTLRLDPDRPASPRGYEFRAPPTLHVLL
jgi:cytochrome P450